MHSPAPTPSEEPKNKDTKLDEETAPEVQKPSEQTQAELRAAYILQQQRMRCPGCGEGDETF